MEIEERPGLLVLREDPKLLRRSLLVIGVGLILLMGEGSTLTCERAEDGKGSCRLVRSTLFGLLRFGNTVPLGEVREFASTESDSKWKNHLRTTSGPVAFTLVHSQDESTTQRRSEVVNAFLQSSEPDRLVIANEPPSMFFILGAFFLFPALFILREQVIEVDTTMGRVRLRTRSLVGKGSGREVSLADVAGVDLEWRESFNSDGRNTRTSRLVFLLRDGRTFPLSNAFSTSNKNAFLLALRRVVGPKNGEG